MNKRKIGIYTILATVIFIIWIVFSFTSIHNDYKKERTILRNNTTYESYIEDISIVSLGNNVTSNGRYGGLIFVQMGSYNQEMYYQIMIKNDNDGKMKYIKLNADDTYIYEYTANSEESPHIEIDWEVRKYMGEIVENKPIHTNADFTGFSDIVAPINNISIHVPEGTVDRSMSVEFQ